MTSFNRCFHFNVNDSLKKEFDRFINLQIDNSERYFLREQAKNYKILIAEDDYTCRKILKIFCETFNYQVNAVENGRLAVNEINNNHYDLILMDIAMPVLNGLNATKEIRELEQGKNKHTLIIAQTAFGDHFDNLCFEAGMDGVMSKPYSFELTENFLACALFLK